MKRKFVFTALAIVVVLLVATAVAAGGFFWGTYAGYERAHEEISNQAFSCPTPPAPFVVETNKIVDLDGQQRYLLCGWVNEGPFLSTEDKQP